MLSLHHRHFHPSTCLWSLHFHHFHPSTSLLLPIWGLFLTSKHTMTEVRAAMPRVWAHTQKHTASISAMFLSTISCTEFRYQYRYLRRKGENRRACPSTRFLWLEPIFIAIRNIKLLTLEKMRLISICKVDLE